jgi:Pvc16 N-terminal domain
LKPKPHHVIRDVGQSLLGAVRGELAAHRSKAKAFLATPTTDFLRKNQPCIVLYLYDLRPFVMVGQGENWELEEEVVDEKGETYVVRYGRPLEMHLKYLLTACADDLADEHEILALGMKAFLDNRTISGEHLVGESFAKSDALAITHDSDFTLATSSTVFGGFGSGPRLAVGYEVDARLMSGRETGRSKRVRERHIDVFDQLRPPPGSVSARELGVEAKPPRIVAAPAKK